MPTTEGRRKSIYGTTGMKILDIQTRDGRGNRDYSIQAGDDVLPWIEQYTEGPFYLSDYSVGFLEPNDVLMFKLAFKR